jgi:hypothetical protein
MLGFSVARRVQFTAGVICDSSLSAGAASIASLTVASKALTVPTAGAAVVGEGVIGRMTEWVTDTHSVHESTLAKTGEGIITIDAAADYTLTVAGTASVSGTNTGDQTGANPTASVGLTAVNGVSTNFLRSDAAQALDQSIAPTWSGIHTFSNTTEASALGTAAVILSGGLSIAKNTLIGGSLIGLGYNTAAGTARLLAYTTSGSLRWQFGVNATAETGSNAGSNFAFFAYDDAGSFLGSAMSITRSTRAVNFPGAVTVTGAFGTNGAAAQTAYASGGALAAYAAGANGLDTGAHMQSMYNLVVAMRAALVANGTMS